MRGIRIVALFCHGFLAMLFSSPENFEVRAEVDAASSVQDVLSSSRNSRS